MGIDRIVAVVQGQLDRENRNRWEEFADQMREESKRAVANPQGWIDETLEIEKVLG